MESKQKLDGFPKVYYVTLDEMIDRQKYMNDQLDYYGIKHEAFISKRFNDMNPKPSVFGQFADTLGQGVGVVISHIKCMENWYNNTKEEVAIFCEDDHDFSSIDSWNFTWNEFIENLPNDWECVQLVRITNGFVHNYPPISNEEAYERDLKLDFRIGRWWGGASLMRRSWVEKILHRHVVGENIYRLDIGYVQPIIENVLYMDLGTVYNFPLLTENNNFQGTIKQCSDEEYDKAKLPHRISEQKIKQCWNSVNTSINDLLRVA